MAVCVCVQFAFVDYRLDSYSTFVFFFFPLFLNVGVFRCFHSFFRILFENVEYGYCLFSFSSIVSVVFAYPAFFYVILTMYTGGARSSIAAQHSEYTICVAFDSPTQ